MERRQLALMFTDIVGYSKLMGQNEAQTIELLGEYRRILLAQIANQHGTVIEFIGDAVFARFDTAAAAVQAGIAMQKDLTAFNRNQDPLSPRLRSRIGIHFGEVTLKDNALFGDDVNIAARLEPLAVADGIAISGQVYDAVKSELAEPVKALGVQPLKNIKSKIRVYLVRPNGIGLETHTHYALRALQQKINAYRYPLLCLGISLFVAGYYFIPRWLVPGYTANYVEIADFKNLRSDSGEADYFSAGITDALRSQLADIREVYIIEADKGIRGPIRLEGSVQRVGSGLRIVYRLFRRVGNVQIAGGKLDGAYEDIFILQDRLVAEVARYLAAEFDLPNFRPATADLTSDVTAYDYYLKGLEYLKMPLTSESNDQAIKQLSTALVHDPDFAEANARICGAYRNTYYLNQNVAWLTTAEEYCKKALEKNDSLVEAYTALSAIYRERGRFSEALKVLKDAQLLDEKNLNLNVEIARVYNKLGEYEKSEKILKNMVKEHPKSWFALHEYAVSLLNRGEIEQSLPVFKSALKLTPENEPVLNDLGIAYFYLGDYKKAGQALSKAVELTPGSFNFSNTGTVLYYAGEYKKAAHMFRQALRLSPDDYRLHMNYADALRQLGPEQKSQALRHYRKGISIAKERLSINSNSADIYSYLAMCYLFLEDIENAKSNLERSLALNSTDVDLVFEQMRFWSVAGDYRKASEFLEPLLNAGYSMDLLESDPDLKDLMCSEEFRRTLYQLKNPDKNA